MKSSNGIQVLPSADEEKSGFGLPKPLNAPHHDHHKAMGQPAIKRASNQREGILSSAQEQLWLIHNADPQASTYNLAAVWKIKGTLKLAALEQSLNALVQRHATLRTIFHEDNDQPVQVVVPIDDFKLRLVKLDCATEANAETEARICVKEEIRRPFDLSQAPLLRATVVSLGASTHILLLVIHHIAADGVSRGMLYVELQELYEAYAKGAPSSLPELEFQYIDYALWERESRNTANYQSQLRYWKKQLEGRLPNLELPADRRRPATFTTAGAHYTFPLTRLNPAELRQVKARENVTSFQVLLAAYKALLFRYTGQEDLIVGFPVAHRPIPELWPLIGYFVHPQAIRTQLHGDLKFRELLRRVRDTSLDALANQDVPFHELVEVLKPERDPSSTPVFQVMFGFDSMPPRLALAGLEVEPFQVESGTSMFDLTLDITETAEGLTGTFEYRTDLFQESTIQRMARQLDVLLTGAVSAPEQPIWQLPLLTPEEQKQVLIASNGAQAELPVAKSYIDLFDEQARKTPSAPAVRFKETEWSYDELNRRASDLAGRLGQLGVKSETLVAIYLDRSLEFAVSVLAILKAGGAYVPLDLANPPERITQILADAQPLVLLSKQEFVPKLPAHKTTLLCLDSMVTGGGAGDFSCAETILPENLAYVIYTSGSTGKPKGVQITHHSLINHNLAIRQAFQLQPTDRALQWNALSFDASVEELFPTWLAGACLVFRTDDALNSMDSFWDLVQREKITVLNLPTAFWHELVEFLPDRKIPECVRLVVIGGDTASVEKFGVWKRNAPKTIQLINSYGPTETTVSATIFVAGDQDRDDLPIGRPLPNTQAYILDGHKQPVPPGIPGELYLGGAGVARGYLNQPELNLQKFLSDPFSSQSGARLYRTGDRARYLADGNIEFLGRVDNQVKLRGFRIEPGEIESALLQHPELRETAVLVMDDAKGQKQLVAYVVANGQIPPSPVALRKFLGDKLPPYMIPSVFVSLEKLPVTAHGKIDRRALPAPPEEARQEKVVAPRNAREKKLASIWCQVLGIKKISIHDNYFDLGGHSLKAVWLFQKIKQEFGKQLPMVTLFQAPTVALLAEVIERESESDAWASLVPIKSSGSKPPFYCVHGVGGNILEFLDLVKYMDVDQPFYGLQAAGLNGKRPQYNSILEMAAHYIEEIKRFQPAGPYYLGGSSFGGMVAYEMAQQFQAKGDKVAMLAFFDTWAPGYPKLASANSWFQQRWYYWQYRVQLHWSNLMLFSSGRERGQYVVTKLKKWKNGKVTQWNELRRRCRTRWEECFLPAEIRNTRKSGHQAADSYVPAPYKGRVILFRATEQMKHFTGEPLRGWGDLVQGGIETYDIPGHHGAIMREPRVKTLAAYFKKALCKAQFGAQKNLFVAGIFLGKCFSCFQ